MRHFSCQVIKSRDENKNLEFPQDSCDGRRKTIELAEGHFSPSYSLYWQWWQGILLTWKHLDVHIVVLLFKL